MRWQNVHSSYTLMSIESVMPSNHLILRRPLLLPPSIFPNIRVFSSESVLWIRWPKYWSFSFSISPSNEHPGLISFRMDCKEIQPVHPKGNQFWVFIGRTDVEVEAPILWPPDAKRWLTWKDPDAGKDWGQEKGTTVDEMVGWHHWVNGHEFRSSGSWWWTGRPGVLLFMGLQGVEHEWATELNWSEFVTPLSIKSWLWILDKN